MFSFTNEEKKVILFIGALSLLGLGIDFTLKTLTPVKSMVMLNQNIGKIDLNSADKDTLMLIPGIGPRLAQRIIDVRTQRGRFTEIEELKTVKSITEARYEKIKTWVFLK